MSKEDNLIKEIQHELDEMQAYDIKVLDVRDKTTVTDYMIIATGRSSRHVKSTAEKVLEKMKAKGMPAISHTGFDSGEWALIDFGDCIVHIMQGQMRLFYNLEELWGDDRADAQN